MYSQQLINEIKELYPNHASMIELAENGNIWLGRHLDDNSSDSLSLKEILEAKSLQEIQDKAKLMLRKRELYFKWKEEEPRSRA